MTGVVGPDDGMGYSGSAKATAIYHEARNCIRKSSVTTRATLFGMARVRVIILSADMQATCGLIRRVTKRLMQSISRAARLAHVGGFAAR